MEAQMTASGHRKIQRTMLSIFNPSSRRGAPYREHWTLPFPVPNGHISPNLRAVDEPQERLYAPFLNHTPLSPSLHHLGNVCHRCYGVDLALPISAST